MAGPVDDGVRPGPPAGPRGQQQAAPNPPENVRLLEIASGRARFTFTPPAAGERPTIYAWRIFRTAWSAWSYLTEIPLDGIELTGLSASSRYWIDVRSGAGDPPVYSPYPGLSGLFVFDTPAVNQLVATPGRPANLRIVANPGGGTAEFAWDAPSPAPTGGYFFRYGLAGRVRPQPHPVGASTFGWGFVQATTATATGLVGGTDYEFQVISRNQRLLGTFLFAYSGITLIVFTAGPPAPPVVPPEDVPVDESLEAAVPLIGRRNVRALAAASEGATNVRPGPLPVDAPRGMRRYLQNVLGGRREGLRAPGGLPPKVRRVLDRSFRG